MTGVGDVTTACAEATPATARNHPVASHPPAILRRMEPVPLLSTLSRIRRFSAWSGFGRFGQLPLTR